MTQHEEYDIIATIMIQNNFSYQTAVVLLLLYKNSVLHMQKTDAILQQIIKSALEEVEQLTGVVGNGDIKALDLSGLFLEYFFDINL